MSKYFRHINSMIDEDKDLELEENYRVYDGNRNRSRLEERILREKKKH